MNLSKNFFGKFLKFGNHCIKDFGCIGSGDPNSLAYGTNCQIKGNGSFKCKRGSLSCYGHFNSDVLCSIKFDSLYEKIQYVANHGLDSLYTMVHQYEYDLVIP